MNGTLLKRYLHYGLSQLGTLGTLGLGLLLLAALLLATLVRKGETDLAHAQARIVALQKQAASRNTLSANAALGQEEQLQIFYQGFGGNDSVPESLKRIFDAAKKQDLVLATGEYGWVRTGSERLARYRIALPVKGPFKQVLGFMDQVLQGDSRLALENAAFKRERVDDPLVEAKLTFVVFVDSQP
jgi:hypothetical protein